MSKTDREALERGKRRRVCECGGELELVCVAGNFVPVARCAKCGATRVGTKGTRLADGKG